MTAGRSSLGRSFVATVAMLAVSAGANLLSRQIRQRARALVSSALRVTHLGTVLSLYRYIAFDLPRATTAVGIGVLLGIAAVRLYLLASHDQPGYLAAYFVLVGALATVASVCMLAGRRLAIVRFGWALGSLVALAALLMYIASRTLGLPDLPGLVGRWEYTLGSFAMVLSASFLAVHFAVLTGMTVAYPQRQQWHD